MAKRLETDRGELGGLAGMDGRHVSGKFRGRVRMVGKRVSVDLSDVDVETENSADMALRRLTGKARPGAREQEVDLEDDI